MIFYRPMLALEASKPFSGKDWTRELHKQGVVLMAGAFTDHPEEPVTTMAVLISRKAAEDFVKGDPFFLNGMVEKWYTYENGATY